MSTNRPLAALAVGIAASLINAPQSHAQESENLSPGGAQNWRATGWEIHPVTGITVLK